MTKREDRYALLAGALLLAGLFAPLLFFGRIAVNEERIGNFYPLSIFFSEAMQGKHAGLWDPYFYGGFPAFADLSIGFYNPLHRAVFSLLPALDAHHLLLALVSFAGLLAAYAFGRLNRFSPAGSAILALAYLTSHTLDGLTIGIFGPYSFLTPPALFLGIQAVRCAQKKWHAVAATLGSGIVMALAIMSGHPQMALYGIVFAAAYAFFLGWRTALAFIGMALLAALLAAPQLLHTAAIAALSIREAGYGALKSMPPPATALWGFLFPLEVRLPYLSGQLNGLYVGALPLLLAFAGIGRRTRGTWFFITAYLVMFALAARLPGISDIHDALPVFSRLPGVGRWAVPAALALAYLAARGFDELRERAPTRRLLITTGIIAFGATAAIIGTNIVLGLAAHSAELKTQLFELGLTLRGVVDGSRYRPVFDLAFSAAQKALSLTRWPVLITTVLWPVSWFILRRRHHAAISIGLVLINLAAVFLGDWSLFAPRAALAKKPQLVTAIEQRERNLAEFRILPVGMAEGAYRDLGALPASGRARQYVETLTGEVGGIWGLQNLYGTEPMRTRRQQRLINELIAPQDPRAFDVISRLPLLSALNVKYLASWNELPASDLLPVPLLPNPALNRTLFLYENLRAQPRAYLATKPIFWNGTEDALLRSLAELKDDQVTYIECEVCAAPTSTPSGEVRVVRYAPGDVELAVDSATGGWVVFNESAMPGWVATVDGVESPIFTANYLMQAISVPPGIHRVTWTYHSILPYELKRRFR